jgi:hypothetical protein
MCNHLTNFSLPVIKNLNIFPESFLVKADHKQADHAQEHAREDKRQHN